MNKIKHHEKAICILKMMDKFREKIWIQKELISANEKMPSLKSYLFQSKKEIEGKIIFYEKCLARLKNYYKKQIIVLNELSMRIQ